MKEIKINDSVELHDEYQQCIDTFGVWLALGTGNTLWSQGSKRFSSEQLRVVYIFTIVIININLKSIHHEYSDNEFHQLGIKNKE